MTRVNHARPRATRWLLSALTALALAASTVGVTSPAAEAAGNQGTVRVAGKPAAGHTVRCATSGLSGRVTYAWKLDRRTVHGATRSSYRIARRDAGKAIACAAKPAGGRAVVSRAVDVTPLPTNSAPPSIGGTPEVGATLTCAPGTWTDAQRLDTFWKRNGSEVATGEAYAVGDSDAGATLVCAVAGWSASGGTGRVDSEPVTIASPGSGGGTGGPTAVPTNDTPPVINGTPAAGETLSCNRGAWTGADSFAWSWTRNGSPTGVTTATYDVAAGDAGATLVCFVTATNGAGTSGAVSSAAVAIASGPTTGGGSAGPTAVPTSSAPPTVSGIAAPGETLTCASGDWIDADSYAWSWTRNGSPTGVTTATYDLTADDAGTTLVCYVTATNAAGTSGAVSAAAITVASAPSTGGDGSSATTAVPTNTSAPLVTGTAAAGETLACSTGAWTDADSYAWSWTRNGSPTGVTTATYGLTAEDAGATLVCFVTATNGAGTSGAVPSAGVSIAAPTAGGGGGGGGTSGPTAVPTNTTDPTITGTPTPGETLTCASGDWTDADSYAWSWTRNGSPTGVTTATYGLTAEDAGATLVCFVTATNGAGTSGAVPSAGVSVS